MPLPKSPPLLHGIVLVAGGAVGAGMFALPIVSAGTGFVWAAVGLLSVWFLTYLAALVLVEVNAHFPLGASFDSLVRARLGSTWAKINNTAIIFIMMVLMYAYTTAGASIIEPLVITYLDPQVLPSRGVLSVLFSVFIGFAVWLGTHLVSKLSALLLVLMIVTFASAIAGLMPHIDTDLLTLSLAMAPKQLGFLWITLPVFVTALACAGLVPSLVKHYQADLTKVRLSLFFGTLTSLVIYIIWLVATLGTLDQDALKDVVLAGGSTGDLVSGLKSVQLGEQFEAEPSLNGPASENALSTALGVFSHFAIITSFLSIALGLFHFIADRFAFDDSIIGKTKTLFISFSPPILMSLFSPFGFVSAIGYAGLAVVFSFFIVPVLMLKRQRQLATKSATKSDANNTRWQLPNIVLNLILLFAIIIIALKLATIFSFLPSFS